MAGPVSHKGALYLGYNKQLTSICQQDQRAKFDIREKIGMAGFPPSQRDYKTHALYKTMDALSEKMDVLSAKIEVLSEKDAVLDKKIVILSKVFNLQP